LKNGEISEYGNHMHLLKTETLYRRAWLSQFGRE
jgi:ABC-type transport system involved in Fe-S cluster assembly fused permease/ATPase subunit